MIETERVDPAIRFSLVAGMAVRYVSQPLFLFLVLRWASWFLVWAALLFRISRLKLKLIPLIPTAPPDLAFWRFIPACSAALSSPRVA